MGAAIAASVILSSLGFAVVYVHAGSVITLLAGPGFESSFTPLRILAAAALYLVPHVRQELRYLAAA